MDPQAGEGSPSFIAPLRPATLVRKSFIVNNLGDSAVSFLKYGEVFSWFINTARVS